MTYPTPHETRMQMMDRAHGSHHAEHGPTEVLRTPYGKWMWWSALQMVDFVPKGGRRAVTNIVLTRPQNTLDEAINAACRRELKGGTYTVRRKEKAHT
jgi:hypothetical protein